MPEKMPTGQVEEAVGKLEGWTAEGNDRLSRSFKFKDHIEAMGFVTRVAMAAEVMDHHPDLRIVYNNVEIHLSSHDAGGVTERDIRLAGRINELL